MKIPTAFRVLLVLVIALAGIPAAWAQSLVEQMAVTSTMDNLSGQAVGGGGAGMNALNQLRGTPAPAAPAGPGAPGGPGIPGFGPAGAPPAYPGAAPGAGMPGQAPTAGQPGAAGQVSAEAGIVPLGETKIHTALVGRRIYDAVTYRKNESTAIILDDVRKIEIADDQLPEYSDDGVTLGDVEANDDIYSQILPRSTNEYIGPESAYYLEKVIFLMNTTESVDPLDFFGLTALTTERYSEIPKLRDRIAEQDAKVYGVNAQGKLSGWADTFLKFYRVEMDNPESKFFPLYVPRYPDPPAVAPPPVPWKPWGHLMLDSIEPVPGAVAGASGAAVGGGGYGGEAGEREEDDE